MIDWLNFTIELQHETIPNGGCVVFDENGDIKRGFDIKRQIDGSHDSTIQVLSTSAFDFYSEVMIQLGLYKGSDSNGQSSAISFYGNPVKYLQGHNVIGTNCLRSLASAVIKDVFPKLGFSDSQLKFALKKIYSYDFWVTKIDITHMFDYGTHQNVENLMNTFIQTVKARGDRLSQDGNTFYIGKHSGLWSFKFYNKYNELISNSKHHKLNPKFKNTGLLAFAKGKLRAELVLRKKQLKRLNLLHASKLQGELDNLFNMFLGRFTMTNQRADKAKLQSLGIRHLNTYYRWKDGDNPKSFLSRPSFYRHRTQLLDIGIDIALPPIPDKERFAEIQPLPEVLSCKVVKWNDIPKNLMPYLIQPIKTKNLIRVA